VSKTTTSIRSLVALDLPKTVPELISFAEQVVTSVTNNPSFPTPSPTLAVISQAIADLQAAQAAAQLRAKGAVQARNDKKTALVKLLQLFKSYVQNIADGDPDTSVTVIHAAGLAVKKAPNRKPHTFAAIEGAISGSVKLVTVSAGSRASYLWQYSTDGGKTWIDAPGTSQAKTTIVGLTAGTTVLFRYRTITPKAGQTDFVPALAFLVK
jgi:hypothetical protein